MKKKKAALTAICALAVFFLCGCSLTGLDAQGLILPPKTNVDQQAIHTLMLGGESEIKFIYPKNGEYRSAVIMQDFTGDKIEDAIGFSVTPEGGIDLQFMTKDQGVWKILAKIESVATQVDRVCFGDLTGNGTAEVIVGWGAPQSMTATIAIYTFSQGEIQEFPLEQNYNELAITDLDGDNVKELFTATIYTPTEEPKGADKKAEARVFTFQEDKPTLFLSCPLSDTVARYSGVSFSKVEKNRVGVVLDGILADNSSITQILYVDDGKLVSPLSGKVLVKKYNYFYRPPSLTLSSKDINGDGIMEYPKVVLQPGYKAETPLESYCYYVDWVQFDTVRHTHIPVSRSIMDMTDNYTLTLPEEYAESVGCFSKDPKELSFRYMRMNSDNTVADVRKFMTIRSFTAEEWAENPDGYDLFLVTHSNVIYGKKIESDSIMAEAILKTFKLISE